MRYVLDTDTVSHLVRGRLPVLDARMSEHLRADVVISAVTRAELLHGLHLKDGAHRLTRTVEQFIARIECLPWDAQAADRFGWLAAHLQKSGTPIGVLDTMIAAHALALGATLVTNNGRHFQRVKGLRVENWLVPE